jgi:hypothetical protein
MIMLNKIEETMPITSVSAVGLVSALCLNLPIQTLVGSFPGVIRQLPDSRRTRKTLVAIYYGGEDEM